jgi:predicted transcriptional regulator with HTH domain
MTTTLKSYSLYSSMRLSQDKKDKIIEQILSYLYHNFPHQPFTAEIAREVIRDEEFIKKILFELKEKGLVVSIKKNSKGDLFSRRIRWRLTEKVHKVYASQSS